MNRLSKQKIKQKTKEGIKMTNIQATLPQISGTYKVVQVTIDDTLHVGFALEKEMGHASILTKILENNGYCTRRDDGRLYLSSLDSFVPAEEQERKVYELVADKSAEGALWSTKIPALSGDGYRVLGMGKAEVDAAQKMVHFYGTSMSYKIGLDKNSIGQLEEIMGEWKLS
ncbi:hypothetical protein J4437_01140 [Candidatus Woesearchaeota archaeon]|nr:hypothetical protein [Candidatus Woesearchaeota archaeon]